MKHRYWFLIIGLVVIFLILRHQITLQGPSSGGTKDPVYNTHPIFQANNLQNITGILLLGPHSSNRNKRSQSLSKNHEFLYGRIYDITYNSALNWFNKLNFPLQLIVENEKYQQYGNDFATLSAQLSGQNITLFKDENLGLNYNHTKTFVGDQRRAIQTANLNRSSFVDNRETFFLSNNEKIRDELLKLFTLDKKKIENPDSVSASDYRQFLVESSDNLLVCPLNCRETLEYLLQNATSRIRISAQYIVDKSLLSLITKQRHLDLRIRTNKSDSNRDLIRAIGQDFIIWEDKIYNHDKLLVIDDLLILGSMNLSDNALDNNREIGIILTDPKYIQQVQHLFKK